ncbi:MULTISPECIES: helix-turn-helix transcriptional regulator [Paenibacillus]|uniref:Transcriptional regulator n=1 Tax=Paenibacillus pabuli TaxID=1472 RepID=A0ABX9BTN6_9BACL|nr:MULTISPECIES: helix-turn-helix transcriptional regulator [Paenibacillus]QLG39560.1 helix-turn-helix transcriptional regulator [Paenibacillus sp. E222]RAJ03581.1 putative transcriptional regulator [Paenibacillus pabuli]SEL85038.1 putative transcriptional regulator [Paenibacillus sp. OK003]SEO05114.1 putative transcriptional regulator [Paenibacillus sp. OK076]
MQNRIKVLRELKDISQGKLAEQCDVSRQTINAIENNKYDPSLPLAFAISEALEVTIEQLFMYERRKS